MKTFRINKELSIVCRFEKTRSGFRHLATLLKNGREVDSDKACYQNRTWESYEYESVIKTLLSKSVWVSDRQRKLFLNKQKNGSRREVAEKFGSLNAIAKMGEIMFSEKKSQNDFKKKIISAGTGGAVSFPSDWEELSEDEKQKRLDGALSIAKEA